MQLRKWREIRGKLTNFHKGAVSRDYLILLSLVLWTHQKNIELKEVFYKSDKSERVNSQPRFGNLLFKKEQIALIALNVFLKWASRAERWRANRSSSIFKRTQKTHNTKRAKRAIRSFCKKKTSDLHDKPKREFPTLFTIKRGHFSNSVEKKVPFYSEKSRDSASLEDTIICSLYQCWMTVLPPSCSWEMERDLGGKLTNFLNGFYSCLNVFFTQQNSTWIKYLGR